MTQSQFMSWPGILCTEEEALSGLATAAVDLFNEGLAALGTARSNEGAKLHNIVSSSLNAIDARYNSWSPSQQRSRRYSKNCSNAWTS